MKSTVKHFEVFVNLQFDRKIVGHLMSGILKQDVFEPVVAIDSKAVNLIWLECFGSAMSNCLP